MCYPAHTGDLCLVNWTQCLFSCLLTQVQSLKPSAPSNHSAPTAPDQENTFKPSSFSFQKFFGDEYYGGEDEEKPQFDDEEDEGRFSSH